VDVERTIEFILDQQARHQARHDLEMAEIRAIMRETQEIARETQALSRETQDIGRRTDARLDRAIRLAVAEARRERKRRQLQKTEANERMDRFEAGLEELRKSVQRYIDSRGNGHNLQN
jgi:hypothetical protein